MLELSLASYLAAAGEERLNCGTSHYQVPTSVLSHQGGTLSNYHLEYSASISSHPCSLSLATRTLRKLPVSLGLVG